MPCSAENLMMPKEIPKLYKSRKFRMTFDISCSLHCLLGGKTFTFTNTILVPEQLFFLPDLNFVPTGQWGASGCLGAGTISEASQVGQSLCCRLEANQIFAYFVIFDFSLLKIL